MAKYIVLHTLKSTPEAVMQALAGHIQMVSAILTMTKLGGTKMTSIGKSRAITISIFILIFLGGSLLQGHKSYAEMIKVSGTSAIIKSFVSLESDLKEVRIRLTNKLHLYSSADPDWDKARVFSTFFYVNPVPDEDFYKGCLAITHQNGDQTFVEYDGSWKWTIPKDNANWTAVDKGYFIGGTGKFDGIKGTITIKRTGKRSKIVSIEWDAEYEIK